MPLFSFLCLAAVAVDGDTLRCSNITDAGGRVRIARIDAPEMRGGDGAAAKTAMARLIAGRKVHCAAVDADPRVKGDQSRDGFGRIVARCRVGGQDLGAAMLVAGLADIWPKMKAPVASSRR
ncbi:thermonuclease family protein [Sphingopyxis sp.]|jgi:endonuclease YncB( thermonuclease family)|uniref:thermonuclease family protein n=1 Tax=Sphingopyxis sp. TaxID=1908224 RepID=UPI003F723E5C